MSRNIKPLADPLNLHAQVQQQKEQQQKQSPPRAGPSSSPARGAGATSGRAPPPTSHLRQRSIGTSPSMPNFPHNVQKSPSSLGGHAGARSPFDDTHAAASASVPDGLNGLGILGQPTPHRAALMQSNASMASLHDTEEGGVGRSQALAMRSERPEWVRFFRSSRSSTFAAVNRIPRGNGGGRIGLLLERGLKAGTDLNRSSRSRRSSFYILRRRWARACRPSCLRARAPRPPHPSTRPPSRAPSPPPCRTRRRGTT
jgi:hypothetical protein